MPSTLSFPLTVPFAAPPSPYIMAYFYLLLISISKIFFATFPFFHFFTFISLLLFISISPHHNLTLTILACHYILYFPTPVFSKSSFSNSPYLSHHCYSLPYFFLYVCLLFSIPQYCVSQIYICSLLLCFFLSTFLSLYLFLSYPSFSTSHHFCLLCIYLQPLSIQIPLQSPIKPFISTSSSAINIRSSAYTSVYTFSSLLLLLTFLTPHHSMAIK